MADPKANEKQGYHYFLYDDAEDAARAEGGSFEVFWSELDGGKDHASGWYWWACFPGCLPDGEPTGPFATSQEAYDNAQEEA